MERGVAPVGSALRRTGITADHLTATGLVMAGATAVAIGSGRLFLGAVLLSLAALPDLLDGAVAKASGTASSRGAFFDSVADRVTDSLLLGGIAWHFAGTSGAGGLLVLLPFAVLGTSTLISYERAKAEALGFAAKGGLMERAERIIALVAGLVIPGALVPVLWLMLALTSLTAVQRFVKVWRQASVTVPTPVKPVRSPTQVGERWRAWRDSTSAADWRATARWRSVREQRRTRSWRRTSGSRRP